MTKPVSQVLDRCHTTQDNSRIRNMPIFTLCLNLRSSMPTLYPHQPFGARLVRNAFFGDPRDSVPGAPRQGYTVAGEGADHQGGKARSSPPAHRGNQESTDQVTTRCSFSTWIWAKPTRCVSRMCFARTRSSTTRTGHCGGHKEPVALTWPKLNGAALFDFRDVSNAV